MKPLQFATCVLSVLLGVGGEAVLANETYGMTKFTFCGIPRSGASASVTITTTAFSEGGARIANATDGGVRICETATGRQIALFAVPASPGQGDESVRFVAFSRDGARLATASGDRMARLWDIAAGRELAALEHPSSVGSVIFSPDGSRLATLTRDRDLRLWDAAAGRQIALLEPPSPVTSAVFSPDGKRLVTTCWEGTVHLWDADTGREITVFNGHDKKAVEARFSPDGARIVTASEDSTARIWDAASGRMLQSLKHGSRVLTVAFNADGTRIVTGAGKEARVFDAASGREIAVLKGHEAEVNDAIFSPDGARIATASEDQSARLWNAASGAVITVLNGHLFAANSVAFGTDGDRIFAVGEAQAVMWSKLSATRLPDNVTGLWFGNFGRPDEPASITRERCMRGPIKINADGLIVFFDAGSSQPPQPALHLRCTQDLTCQMFAGAPAQGLEAQGTVNIALSGNAGKFCQEGQCQPLARCPQIKWTEQERKSGFAKRWEAEVHAPRR